MTRELYRRWIPEAKKEGKRLAFTVFRAVMAVGTLLYFLLCGHDPLFLFLALYCAFMILPRDLIAGGRMYKRLLSLQGTRHWVRTVTVTREEIVVCDGSSQTTPRTADIKKVTRDERVIRVFMNNGTSLRLYTDSFTEGTPEDCLRLLHE